MLEDGLSYPMQGDSWIGRILIGGLMIFLSFLVVPAFAVSGYLLRILETTAAGEPEPPEWDDWGGLIVDGIKALIVTMVYSFVPVVVVSVLGFLLLGAGGIFGAALGDSGGGLVAGLGLTGALLLGLLLIPAMFVVYYLVPAALTNMAVEGNLSAAFDFSTMKGIVLSSDYFIAVLMPILIGILVNIAVTVLSITVVGLLLVPFVSFYGYVSIFRMFGLVYQKQVAKGGTSPTSSAAAV